MTIFILSINAIGKRYNSNRGLKTRNAHWNVEGPDFHEKHVFFDEQYELLDKIMDDPFTWALCSGDYERVFATHTSNQASGSRMEMAELAWLTHLLPLPYFYAQTNGGRTLSDPSNSERALLESVAEGDQKAFTRLVDLYWNKVYGHALAYTKSSPRAQEITQDVFLRVWNKRQALFEVNDFNKFLFILGRNQIVSSMRKRLVELTGKEPVDVLEDILVPDQQLEYKQVHDKIMEAIEKLPPTRKLVFKMSRIEGMTYEEISQRLNISRNTVKEHIVLGLSFVRTFIHMHGDIVVLFFFILDF